MRLFWFATGKDDSLLPYTRTTVELLKKHDFNIEFDETTGIHNWITWRDYLHQFAPGCSSDRTKAARIYPSSDGFTPQFLVLVR